MLVKMRELTKQRDGLVELLEFTKLDGMVMIELVGVPDKVFQDESWIRKNDAT